MKKIRLEDPSNLNGVVHPHCWSTESPDAPNVIDDYASDCIRNLKTYTSDCAMGHKSFMFIQLFKRYAREKFQQKSLHKSLEIPPDSIHYPILHGGFAPTSPVYLNLLRFVLYVTGSFDQFCKILPEQKKWISQSISVDLNVAAEAKKRTSAVSLESSFCNRYLGIYLIYLSLQEMLKKQPPSFYSPLLQILQEEVVAGLSESSHGTPPSLNFLFHSQKKVLEAINDCIKNPPRFTLYTSDRCLSLPFAWFYLCESVYFWHSFFSIQISLRSPAETSKRLEQFEVFQLRNEMAHGQSRDLNLLRRPLRHFTMNPNHGAKALTLKDYVTTFTGLHLSRFEIVCYLFVLCSLGLVFSLLNKHKDFPYWEGYLLDAEEKYVSNNEFLATVELETVMFAQLLEKSSRKMTPAKKEDLTLVVDNIISHLSPFHPLRRIASRPPTVEFETHTAVGGWNPFSWFSEPHLEQTSTFLLQSLENYRFPEPQEFFARISDFFSKES